MTALRTVIRAGPCCHRNLRTVRTRPLPPHSLVTSRMEIGSGTKSVHYALMCWSQEELLLEDRGPFDPSAYRNAGEAGGAVSNSQVTALIVRTGDESPVSDYRINLRAKLTGSYWVKLGRPCMLGEAARRTLSAVAIHFLHELRAYLRSPYVALENNTLQNQRLISLRKSARRGRQSLPQPWLG